MLAAGLWERTGCWGLDWCILRPMQSCQANHDPGASDGAQDWLTSLDILLFMAVGIQCDQKWCVKETLSCRTVCVYLQYFRKPEYNWLCARHFLLFCVILKKYSMQSSFCSLLHTVFPLLPHNYDFEANECGWFPWYKITSFTERALQPALIGHDMFQGCVCKHRCLSIAGMQQLIRHMSKGKHWVSLSEWQTQESMSPGHQITCMVLCPFLNCFVSYWQDQEEQAYFAVFDGHGGVDAAIYASVHLHVNLVRQEMFPHDPAEALCRAFRVTDERFVQKAAREVWHVLVNSGYNCTSQVQPVSVVKGLFRPFSLSRYTLSKLYKHRHILTWATVLDSVQF